MTKRHDVHSRSWHGFIPTRGERGGDSHLYSDSYSELSYIISAISATRLSNHVLNCSNAESLSKPLNITVTKICTLTQQVDEVKGRKMKTDE